MFPKCKKCDRPILPGRTVVEQYGYTFCSDCAIRLGAGLIAGAVSDNPMLEGFALNILKHTYKGRGLIFPVLAEELQTEKLLSPAKSVLLPMGTLYTKYELRVTDTTCYYCGEAIAKGELCTVFQPETANLAMFLHSEKKDCAASLAEHLQMDKE